MRRILSRLRSARVRRETYVGAWLPEPLLTDAATPAPDHAEMAESLSMAFLLLLERLSPVERVSCNLAVMIPAVSADALAIGSECGLRDGGIGSRSDPLKRLPCRRRNGRQVLRA